MKALGGFGGGRVRRRYSRLRTDRRRMIVQRDKVSDSDSVAARSHCGYDLSKSIVLKSANVEPSFNSRCDIDLELMMMRV